LHKAVLVDAVLSYLSPKPGQIIVDGTVGSGGHAEALLEQISPGGMLIGLDQDDEAVGRAKKRLAKFHECAILKHANFTQLDQILEGLNLDRVNAVLLDIGVSSEQLEDPRRGFSFVQDGPLDMRMDPVFGGKTARMILEKTHLSALISIFGEYGEERFSKRIARAIISRREQKPLETTYELKALIEANVPGKYRHGRIHPATRVFQALRIAVNDELDVLKDALPKAFDRLMVDGRLAVISFHSLEDRIVKRFFVSLKQSRRAMILTKKPVQAGEQELKENPRARSAKLRVIERIT